MEKITEKLIKANITPKAATIHHNTSGWFVKFKSVAAKVKYRKTK